MLCCNDEHWFRAKDVAAILDYNDSKHAIANSVYSRELAIRNEHNDPLLNEFFLGKDETTESEKEHIRGSTLISRNSCLNVGSDGGGGGGCIFERGTERPDSRRQKLPIRSH